jgi:MoaA/NifB/PqqE/SkfB family radical SAM enzyme
MNSIKTTIVEWNSFIRVLTPVRVGNYLLLFTSHVISILTGRFFRWGHPSFFTLEPANLCNLSCPECVTGSNGLNRKHTFLSLDDARIIIGSLRRHAMIANLYFQGEPILNPELPEIIKTCSNARIYSIVSTNGQNLTKEIAERLVGSGLKKIIVSLDGITQETYAKYRVRGQLDKVLNAINHLSAAKKELRKSYPVIEVQFIAFRHNEHEIDEARAVSMAAGANRFSIKTAQFYDAQRAAEWSPLNTHLRRYKQPENLEVKGKGSKGCFKAWSTYVGCSGGEIAFCCMDKNALYGATKHAETNWNNTAMNQKRKSITEGDFLPICLNCPFKGTIF